MPARIKTARGASRTVRLVDLFAGIGGFHYGFAKAASDLGCDVSAHLVAELDEECRLTYLTNHDVDPRRIVGDVMDIDVLGPRPPRADVVTAGFPCQPFSNSGAKRGLKDPRGRFLEKILAVVEHYRARAFVLENVPGILTNGGGRFDSLLVDGRKVGRSMHRIELLLADLDDYHVTWFELDSSEVGSPQVRKRVFIVGTKKRVAQRFDPTRIRRSRPRPFTSVKDHRLDAEPGGLELTKSQETNVRATMRRPPVVRGGLVRVGSAYLCEGGNVGQAYHSHGLMPTLTKVWARFLPIYIPSEPEVLNMRAPLLGADKFEPDRRSYGRTGKIRRASVREVMRLQGFPDEFEPHHNESIAYAQAGNAVHAGVVARIAEVLLDDIGFKR